MNYHQAQRLYIKRALVLVKIGKFRKLLDKHNCPTYYKIQHAHVMITMMSLGTNHKTVAILKLSQGIPSINCEMQLRQITR